MNLATNYGVGDFGLSAAQAPDTTKREVCGTIVNGVDPVWGGRELIYAKYAGNVRRYGLVVLTAVWVAASNCFELQATEVGNTANLGRSLAVAPFSGVDGQYGWFIIAGSTPVNCTASVAANTAFGIAAAGQGGANAAGKQILNAVVSIPATQTIAKANCRSANASKQLQVPDTDGWFIGAYLSGTGIAAGTTVEAIDPSGRFVTLSLDTTAAVAGTVTATFNNATVYYNVATLNRPFAQGAIT